VKWWKNSVTLGYDTVAWVVSSQHFKTKQWPQLERSKCGQSEPWGHSWNVGILPPSDTASHPEEDNSHLPQYVKTKRIWTERTDVITTRLNAGNTKYWNWPFPPSFLISVDFHSPLLLSTFQINRYCGSFPGVKQVAYEVVNSPPSSA